MSTPAKDFTLAELCIVAAAEAFRDDGEVLATGIGVIPRLAASLAMKTFNPIRAPQAGIVMQILIADSSPVEYGEALVILE